MSYWVFESLGTALAYQNHIHAVIEEIQKNSISRVVVVGIGGSSLGVRAIAELLTPKIPMTFLESVDAFITPRQFEQLEQYRAAGETFVCCLVSKSGKTPETIMNGALLYERMRSWFPHDYQARMVVITTEQSQLAVLARNEQWHLVTMPDSLSGRYSVFSAVGMVPLALAGVNIQELWSGVRAVTREDAQQEANTWAQTYAAGVAVHDLVVTSPVLSTLGLWLRQLIGEGLGKQFVASDGNMRIGPTPALCVATDDFHSIFQQQIAGSHGRLMTIISLGSARQSGAEKYRIAPMSPFVRANLVAAGMSVSQVHAALVDSFTKGYVERAIPQTHRVITELNEENIGYLMQYYMSVIALTGVAIGINPFDQPYVEQYKCPTALRF